MSTPYRYQLMTVEQARAIITDPDYPQTHDTHGDRIRAWRVYDHWMTPAQRRATDIEKGERLAAKKAREAARREYTSV